MPYIGRNTAVKSAAQKKAEGRGITHPLAKSTSAVQPQGKARVPRHLSKVEQGIWRDVVRSMPVGTYTVADEGLLEKFVISMVLIRKCQEVLDKDGMTILNKTGLARHPLLQTLNAAMTSAQIAGESLGLSPTSRNRLVAPVDKPMGIEAEAEGLFGAEMAASHERSALKKAERVKNGHAQ